uniref:RGS domain-containing protein n=1 Tax=Macrostomum lignano TaxID=282301 RepID=A0A1I8JQH5_9PLAT
TTPPAAAAAGGGGGGRNNRNGSRSHSGDAPDGPIGDEGGDGGGEARRGNKTCCFCWCCCCSCSCISKEEAKQWGESFDALMQSANGRKVFREYLKSEYSEENILFWLACEDLKLESTPEGVEEKARVIYEDYISILSPKENMVEPTAHTFDDAQVQIFTLMHRDSYPRFLNSHFYRQLVSDGAATS